MANEPTTIKRVEAAGETTVTWSATTDELCVGWRVTAEVGGSWRELVRSSDPATRSLTVSVAAGAPMHLMALLKGAIAEVPKAVPAPAPEPVPSPPPPSGLWRPWSDASPYNTPIPANPVLDPSSASMVAQLGTSCQAMLHQYANPVIEPPSGTPGVHVKVENHWAGFYEGNVPIPKGSGPSQGSDASLIVLDRVNNVGWDFWRLKWTGSEWVCGYCSQFPLTGMGASPEVNYGACGAGVPLLAGMIRASEIQAGVISHAIDIATKYSGTGFRWPATKTDGHVGYPPGLPEGARLQLDPNVTIPGSMSKAQKAIWKVAQVYGILVKNTTEPAMAMGFEDVGPVVAGNPYYDAGLTSDGVHFPLEHLRVLRKWDGT